MLHTVKQKHNNENSTTVTMKQ